jgi:ribosomal protein S27AE
MQEENRGLREKVKELEGRLGFAQTLRFEPPLYFAADDKTPFCARCWESDRRAIHLEGDWGRRRWECHQCKSVYLLNGTAKPGVMFDVI